MSALDTERHPYDKDKFFYFNKHDLGPKSQAITSASHLFVECLTLDVVDPLAHVYCEQDFRDSG